MASGILVDIQKELTCSICLEFLTEPMSLDCGHSFCQACITANSRQSMVGQERESSCPVCRITYQPEKLRPNRHLVTIVEMLKEVKLSPEEEQKRDLCARHGEKLLLFCKKDGEIICWLCERSQEHRGHHTFLIEDAAQEYKKKILEALDSLKANQLKAEKWESDIRKERTSWENQIQRESKRAQDYFKQLRSILDSEEQKELQKLKEGKGDIFNDLAQAERELVQQNQLLTDLILDLEHRLQGPTVGMLQNVKSIIKRSKTFTLKKPKALSKEQRSVFQPPDLSGMLQRLNELTDMRRYWVRVTLDPHRTKSNVDISADRKQVTCVLGRNTNYTYETCENEDYGVLGSPAITSGKHYWEVDVSEKRAWVLGVCAEKCLHSKRMMRSFRKGNNCQHVYSKCQPSCGYWVIALVNQSEYNAFEDGFLLNPLTVTLTLTVPPSRVGVFVDYNAGTVSFSNVTNHGLLIYKFSSCSFYQKIFPYFNPMKCTGPLKLCSPSP